jgi:hypothetical protein
MTVVNVTMVPVSKLLDVDQVEELGGALVVTAVVMVVLELDGREALGDVVLVEVVLKLVAEERPLELVWIVERDGFFRAWKASLTAG